MPFELLFLLFFVLCCRSSKNSVRDRPIDCDAGGFGDIGKKKMGKNEHRESVKFGDVLSPCWARKTFFHRHHQF